MDGWIKIHRQITDNLLWDDKPFAEGQAWIDLLLAVTYDRGSIKVKNGQRIELRRGECGYSNQTLANRWGWSRGKVTRFLQWLENEKMIQQKNVSNFNIIKVLNFDIFQNDTTNSTTNDTTNGHQMIQQTDTIKKVKKVKKEKKYICAKFIKPTLQEIQSYCLERKNNVEVQKFYNYYESNGWKVGRNPMKDWKAAIRNWERNTFVKKEEPTSYKRPEYNSPPEVFILTQEERIEAEKARQKAFEIMKKIGKGM